MRLLLRQVPGVVVLQVPARFFGCSLHTTEGSYSCLLSVRRYQHALLEAQGLAVELLGQKWQGATRRTPDDEEPGPGPGPEPEPELEPGRGQKPSAGQVMS